MDTHNDSITNDDEFAIGGVRGWTEYKLQRKIDHIAKVILAATEFNYPDVVGLCEVENYQLLERLLYTTPLRSVGYRYIHRESPDGRGIDVAMLYRPERIEPLSYKHHPLIASSDTLATREILECLFKVGNDSLRVFINHWPSRYGGEQKSAPNRMLAAQTLWQVIGENKEQQSHVHNIVLGDFNDEPNDASLQWLCQSEHQLRNLSSLWNKNRGTLKYQGIWSIFDQIIISEGLVDKVVSHEIVNLPFLLQADEKWGGEKLFRTYYGFQYEGGFSDHLPVKLILDL